MEKVTSEGQKLKDVIEQMRESFGLDESSASSANTSIEVLEELEKKCQRSERLEAELGEIKRTMSASVMRVAMPEDVESLQKENEALKSQLTKSMHETLTNKEIRYRKEAVIFINYVSRLWHSENAV